MRLFVKGEYVKGFDVEPHAPIAELYRKVFASMGDGTLMFAGQPLNNEGILSDYNVRSESVIHHFGRLLGGLTVFTDPVSGKQMISDAFPSELCKTLRELTYLDFVVF